MGAISKKTKTRIGKECKHCGNIEKYLSGGCTFCTRKYAREIQKKYPEKLKLASKISYKNRIEKIRDYRLRSTYNYSLQEYNELLEIQKGVCAICHNTCVTGKRLSVDHCHVTSKIRGLLCTNCNRGIGNFRDNISILENAINYLRRNHE